MNYGYRTKIAVVGTDREWADIDNPRGEIFGEVYELIAEEADGSRYIVCINTKDEAQAIRQVARLERLDAVPAKYLEATYPVYGSEAYQRLDEIGHWRAMEKIEG